MLFTSFCKIRAFKSDIWPSYQPARLSKFGWSKYSMVYLCFCLDTPVCFINLQYISISFNTIDDTKASWALMWQTIFHKDQDFM